MHGIIQHRRSSWRVAIVALLSVQGILGLPISLSQLVVLLAPNRPVIVHGASIFSGPVAGSALAVALASLIIAWGLWMQKRWAGQRIVLLEIFSLGIGVLELTAPDINRWVPVIRLVIAVLILICLYADFRVRSRSLPNV
jgi:uncharacterized membrane protein (DUF2068 family)